MKKKLSLLINQIKYETLEEFVYYLLLFWIFSPVIEYFFKKYVPILYKTYFVIAIYVVGGVGIISVTVYLIKQKRDGQISKKKYQLLYKMRWFYFR